MAERRSLAQWLRWQESLHPAEIELGLSRTAEVLSRLDPGPIADRVVTIGGTNGKGSCVAFLDAIANAAGLRVGAYSSPHLLCYNERVRLDGRAVSDEQLCLAFERVDEARGDIPLTYFEFGTLAALTLIAAHDCDLALLEVGLGGRLDAVNVIDPDCALITSIGIDHTAWLGTDREMIGLEKAGIFRTGQPAVCGDAEPPDSIFSAAQDLGVDLRVAGKDFSWQRSNDGWRWQGRARRISSLVAPAMAGEWQFENAAACLAVLESLHWLDGRVDLDALNRGLAAATLAGRMQRISEQPLLLMDVAHNPDAASRLASGLTDVYAETGWIAVLGMLDDKDVEGVVAALRGHVSTWFCCGLPGVRGIPAQTLSNRVAASSNSETISVSTPAEGLDQAMAALKQGEGILVLGSFLTVAAALEYWNHGPPCGPSPV